MFGSGQSARDWKPSPPPVFIQSLVRMPTRLSVRDGTPCDAVVLRAAIDVVEGQGIVHRDAVELRDRNVVEVAPGAAVVVGFVEAAVIAYEQVIGVGGVEGEGVVVGVDLPAGGGDGLAAVFADAHRHVHEVDAVVL